jgi:hypothetical protein
MSGKTPFILVVSYGRTGSTLLKELLNTDPRAEIQGENGMALRGLMDVYESLVSADSQKRDDPTSPWHTHVDVPCALENMELLIEGALFGRPDAIKGFKDVGYRKMQVEDIRSFIGMFATIYDLTVIANFRRDKEALMASLQRGGHVSGFYHPKSVLTGIEAIEAAVIPGRGYRYVRIDYEDLHDLANLERVFEVAGLEFEPGRVLETLQVPYSNRRRPGLVDSDGVVTV